MSEAKSGVRTPSLKDRGRQAGVALGVPVAADVRAVAVGGVHHADGIPGEQLVPGLDVLEPNVGEPIVQGSHPAGGGSAVTGGQAVDLGDVAAVGPGLGIAPPRAETMQSIMVDPGTRSTHLSTSVPSQAAPWAFA